MTARTPGSRLRRPKGPAESTKPAEIPHEVVVRLQSEHAANLPLLLKVLESLPPKTAIVRGLDRFGRAVVRLPNHADVDEVVAELKRNPVIASAEAHFVEYSS